MSQRNSYGQILRSSSILGGAQLLNYVVSLLRVKAVAVLIGPLGVGLVGLFTSATTLLSAIAALGISSSSVRRLAQHEGDWIRISREAEILRRLAFITGAAGWLLTILLADKLSLWLTGDTRNSREIALLGSVVMLTCIGMSYQAVLQGLRRVGDYARANIFSVVVASLLTIPLYMLLRENGIVPVLIMVAIVTTGSSWWYVRRLRLEPVSIGARELAKEGVGLAKLGLAFVWSGILVSGVDVFARSQVSRQFGIDEAGYYQAAWGLSGMFAGFVLGAMGTDFYPRLAAVIGDRVAAKRLVNEQTEIGILLASPGLVGTLTLTPWLIPLLFSRQFLPAAEVLPWFVLGVFGRVVSWPLGFIQLATGAARWYVVTETAFVSLHVLMLLWLIPKHGAKGAALAFFLTYLAYIPAMLFVAWRLIRHQWTAAVWRLVGWCALTAAAGLILRFSLKGALLFWAGLSLTTLVGLFSLRAILLRLPRQHPMLKKIEMLPGARWWL